MIITYPVRAAADGTERIVDAAGQVLGTVEIVEEWNEMQRRLAEIEQAAMRTVFAPLFK